MLRRSLRNARAELAATPESRKAFDHMVIVGHSMGGLVSKTLLQDPGDQLVRKASGRSWEEIKQVDDHTIENMMFRLQKAE